jgi:Glycolipid transfer protein (GLTP)
MEFVVAMLQRLHDDVDLPLPQAASEAYYATLHQYHGWITSAAFIVALKAIPYFCQSKPL